MAELYSNPELNVKRKRRWGWIIIFLFFGGLISSTEKINVNESLSITIILYFVSAITAPIFYYWLKPKVKFIKNNLLKSFIIGIAVIVIFALLSAILGAISYALIYQYNQ